jgi:stringent starvation protein B
VKDASTTPYLLRAIYEWCEDNGLTPYVVVKVDEFTRVPQEFVKDGEIVLNVSSEATRDIKIDNERIQFAARFAGVSRELSIPIGRVSGIFAKETGQGLAFQVVEPQTAAPAPEAAPVVAKSQTPPPQGGKPKLQIVK